MITVSDLSERELVARVSGRLPPAPPWMIVGIGDDAAVVEGERNRLDVLTVDAIVEGIHFDRRFTPAAAIGHRALAVNLSDIAAMGAQPRLALLSFALPADLPCSDFDDIVGGITRLAARHDVHVAGGNLTRSPGPLMLDVTVTGAVKRRSVLRRSGAAANDDVYVTGSLGSARAGLQYLQHRDGAITVPGLESCVDRYLYPDARVRAGTMLGRNRAASACMDLSDGLGDGVRRIAEASDVGITIDADAVPIDPAARAWFAARRMDPVLEAIAGGDDYELLFTVSRRQRRRMLGAMRGGVPITRIGTCTPEPGLRLLRTTAPLTRETGVPEGFTHFR